MKKSKITEIIVLKNNAYSLHLELIINNRKTITIVVNKKKPYTGQSYYEYYGGW